MPQATRNRLFVLAVTVLPATLAFAQGHGATAQPGHTEPHEAVGPIPTTHQGLATAITAIVVFCVVLAVLATKVWPTISKALDERANKIKGEIEAAEAARMTAKAALEEYQANIAQARAEAQKMIADAKAQQQVQFAEMKAKADAELAAMKSKAVAEIDAARKAALADVYTKTAALATAVAGKILQREVNAADQQRFVNEALAGIKN
ncbi:MAG: F0F1 ATP synthase subunit B [Phycisphaerales bacterium]|nr:F0F1 ATP synthase subunit B [Phycisphaerales bacterium]